jgi:hypothetical protein
MRGARRIQHQCALAANGRHALRAAEIVALQQQQEMGVLVRVLVHVVLGHGRPQFGKRQRTDFALRAIVSKKTSVSEGGRGGRHGSHGYKGGWGE